MSKIIKDLKDLIHNNNKSVLTEQKTDLLNKIDKKTVYLNWNRTNVSYKAYCRFPEKKIDYCSNKQLQKLFSIIKTILQKQEEKPYKIELYLLTNKLDFFKKNKIFHYYKKNNSLEELVFVNMNKINRLTKSFRKKGVIYIFFGYRWSGINQWFDKIVQKKAIVKIDIIIEKLKQELTKHKFKTEIISLINYSDYIKILDLNKSKETINSLLAINIKNV